jgi:hypothetical protein
LVVDAFIELKKRGRHPDVRLHCAGAMTKEDARYVAELKSNSRGPG